MSAFTYVDATASAGSGSESSPFNDLAAAVARGLDVRLFGDAIESLAPVQTFEVHAPIQVKDLVVQGGGAINVPTGQTGGSASFKTLIHGNLPAQLISLGAHGQLRRLGVKNDGGPGIDVQNHGGCLEDVVVAFCKSDGVRIRGFGVDSHTSRRLTSVLNGGVGVYMGPASDGTIPSSTEVHASSRNNALQQFLFDAGSSTDGTDGQQNFVTGQFHCHEPKAPLFEVRGWQTSVGDRLYLEETGAVVGPMLVVAGAAGRPTRHSLLTRVRIHGGYNKQTPVWTIDDCYDCEFTLISLNGLGLPTVNVPWIQFGPNTGRNFLHLGQQTNSPMPADLRAAVGDLSGGKNEVIVAGQRVTY